LIFKVLTIKRKLVTVIVSVLFVTLSALAFILISNERARVIADISENAIHFAELSAERIGKLFDNFSQAPTLFQNEFSKILANDSNINRVQIAATTGRLIFSSDGSGISAELSSRLRSSRISVATKSRTIFLNHGRFENQEGQRVAPLKKTAQITSIVFPLPDNFQRVIFYPSYSEVSLRIRESILHLLVLFVVSFAISVFIATWLAASITAPLEKLREGARRIARGNLKTKIEVDNHDETKMLADTFNQMSNDLTTAVESKIKYERAKRELEVAKEIQMSTLPKKVEVSGLDLAVSFMPANEVGGDVYDFISQENGNTVFYLGDATGHGVPAGMIAALTNAIVVAAAEKDAEEILSRTNKIIFTKTKPNIFITLALFIWNSRNHRLVYANAGHESPLIFRAATGSVESASRGGLALGMRARLWPKPKIKNLKLNINDFLLVFSDGIIEAKNSAGEQLGSDGLKNIFVDACRGAKSATEVCNLIDQKARDWREGVVPRDDITFFVLRRKS